MVKKFVSTIFLLFYSQFVLAQINQITAPDSVLSFELNQVLITATKTNSTVLELANSISVIDSEMIVSSRKENVYELLKGQYGLVTIRQGAPGSLTNVNLRGAGSGHALILIDGIEVNDPTDPSNSFDFADLSTDNIFQIEILRGPQSVLYGSDALSGVINIITRKGTGRPEYNLGIEGGSYNSFKGFLSTYGKLDRLNYSVNLSRVVSEGFSSADEKFGNTEKDGFQNLNVGTNLGFNASDNLNFDLFLRFNKSETDLDQFGGEFGDDPTYIYEQEELSAKLQSRLNLFSGFWKQTLGVSYYKNLRKYHFDRSEFNPALSRSFYNGNKIKLDWQNDFQLADNNLFSFGADAEIQKVNSEYFYSDDFGEFESILPENDLYTYGVFLQDQISFNRSFFMSAGMRFDSNEKFGNVVTYRIAPAYFLANSGTKFKSSVGTGFKSPSIFYLYDPAFGNPDLQPEHSFGWDAGIEQYFFKENFMAGITYFKLEFSDLFGFDDNFKSININKASSEGIEFYLKAKPLDALNINFNYTFNKTKDMGQNPDDRDKSLLRRPEHKAALGFTFNFTEKFSAFSEVIFIGSRDDKNYSVFPAERIKMDSYMLLNISAGYRIYNLISIYFRIENLLDADYQEVYGYGTAGISASTGFRIRI